MFGRLLLLFITVPVIELALFLTVGEWIGLPATLAIIVLTGFLGAWLTKKQGLKVLQGYRQSLSEGRLPHQEVIKGLLVLVAEKRCLAFCRSIGLRVHLILTFYVRPGPRRIRRNQSSTSS